MDGLTKEEVAHALIKHSKVSAGGILPDTVADKTGDEVAAASASHETTPSSTPGYFLPDMKTPVEVPQELLQKIVTRRPILILRYISD